MTLWKPSDTLNLSTNKKEFVPILLKIKRDYQTSLTSTMPMHEDGQVEAVAKNKHCQRTVERKIELDFRKNDNRLVS